MLYTTYQAAEDLLLPARAWTALVAGGLGTFPRSWQDPFTRHLGASARLATLARVRHERPAWGIDDVVVDGRSSAVWEEAVDVTPFCTLRRFVKADVSAGSPVLVVAPLSGHFATLLRETVATLLLDHDVYVTEWHNARDVPVGAGDFGADDAIDVIIRHLRLIGPGNHVLAVCQPCPSALIATAVLAAAGDEAAPKSLTLMAGPVDARINPTVVNELASTRPAEWFEEHFVTSVPWRYAGRGRQVYPGFLQLAAFMAMNPRLHVKRHLDAYVDMVSGDGAAADVVEAFYAEYYAVLDLPARFYLETVQRVFQRFDLACGVAQWRGEPVELAAIRDTALLTVEGARDDVCGRGQTAAALALCPSIPAKRKHAHVEPGVGHYGVFSGHRWRTSIYPVVRDFVVAHDRAATSTTRV
jgi:poly(3-hydroxybutyrate) depolymerase